MGMGITGILQGISGAGSNKDLYGSKPVVPKGLDYGSLIAGATKSNIQNLPSLSDLASKSTDEINNLIEQSLPGFKSMRDTATGIIQSELRGEVPKDVQARLQNFGAASGIASGTASSGFNKNLTLRDFGLTSLQEQQRGLSNAQSWIQQAQGRTFDFSKMFISPEMAIDQGKFNWSRDWLASQVAAAPDPAKRGAFDTEMGFIGEVLSAYGGGAGYQGYNRQQYQAPGGGGMSPSGNPWGTDYGHESFFGGLSGFSGGTPEGPNQGTGEGW